MVDGFRPSTEDHQRTDKPVSRKDAKYAKIARKRNDFRFAPACALVPLRGMSCFDSFTRSNRGGVCGIRRRPRRGHPWVAAGFNLRVVNTRENCANPNGVDP
jgi:hypothetical protein